MSEGEVVSACGSSGRFRPLPLGPLSYPCALVLEPGLGLVVREGLNDTLKVSAAALF